MVRRMTVRDSLQHPKMKLALLQRFRYTCEGYRDKFRNTRPEEDETHSQYAASITRYFHRWIEMAEVENDFNQLKDRMIAGQFLRTCSN